MSDRLDRNNRPLGIGLIGAALLCAVFFAPTACNDEPSCPSPAMPRLELGQAELQALADEYSKKDVKGLFDECDPVAVGIDSRNGLVVYAEVICDDLCPDYTKQVLTYGPDSYGDWEKCREVGFCAMQMGASPGTLLRCLPVIASGVYGYCF